MAFPFGFVGSSSVSVSSTKQALSSIPLRQWMLLFGLVPLAVVLYRITREWRSSNDKENLSNNINNVNNNNNDDDNGGVNDVVIPGEDELLAACRVWEQQLNNTLDPNISRKLRLLLRQGYTLLDMLHTSFPAVMASATTLITATRTAYPIHDHGSNSSATSESFLSATDVDTTRMMDASLVMGQSTPYMLSMDGGGLLDDVDEVGSSIALSSGGGFEHITATTTTTTSFVAVPIQLPSPSHPHHVPINIVPLYESSLARARAGEVHCRKIRLGVSGCDNDTAFLACVCSIREGFREVLRREADRTWIHATGTAIMARIFLLAGRPFTKFEGAYESIMRYVVGELQVDGGQKVLAELATRKVAELSFYDLVLDFTILDALDDLENPPSALTTAMRAWVPQSVKQKLLDTAVVAFVGTKRSRSSPDGFMTRYYDVMEEISPVLAWGLLGPESPLSAASRALKDCIIGFTSALFRTAKTAQSPTALADDIMALARTHTANVFASLPS